VKTTSDAQAEQIYKSFVGQTEKLAEVDIRRIKLEAEKSYTEQLIAAQETRLNALQNDLVVQQQQEQNVSVQQDQARQQAQLLSNKQQAARNELRGLQTRIRTLEAQQTMLDNSNFGDAKATSKK
jgi:chromosome segregation ATPase